MIVCSKVLAIAWLFIWYNAGNVVNLYMIYLQTSEYKKNMYEMLFNLAFLTL